MKKIKITTLLLILMVSLFSFNKANENNSAILNAQAENERMFKAVWVSPLVGDVRLNGESIFKSNMTNVLNKMEEYGYNALIFHIRIHNDAIYPSSLNPKSNYVSNINFNNFDPLEWLIDETHKRGIEFHAWLNPYRTSEDRHVGNFPSSNPARNPDNVLTHPDHEDILDPAKPEVKTFVADTVEEVITNYDVDAIHFDDYFYIRTNSNYSYDDNQKREHVNDMVEGVYNKIQTYNNFNNKHIQFGISPTGIYKNGNGRVFSHEGKVISSGSAGTTGQQHHSGYLCADTLFWMNEGWIDYIMPQIYWQRDHNSAPYKNVLDWWDEVCSHLDVNLYIGLGLYRSDEAWGNDNYELSAQMTLIENANDTLGYTMFSYKHFKQGGTNSVFGEQLNRAYNLKPKRKQISVLPEIKSMNPLIPAGVSSNHINGTLNWTRSNEAKFYYLYRSSGQLTYSDEELFKVVGKDIHTYNTNDFSNSYNYGVKVLSPTNHLSGQSLDEPIESYTIDYVLNGGNLVTGYTNRDEMLADFFNDYYSYIKPGISYNDFVHGTGRTSGYGGVYDELDYFNHLYEPSDKSVNPSLMKFINLAKYNKWVALFDIIDDYVKAINLAQSFWDSAYEGRIRFKDFMQKNTYGKQSTVPLLNQIPEELSQEIIYTYNKETPTITLPQATKDGTEFLGWYDNYNYLGSPVTKISSGATGNKTFYAKWENDEPIKETYTVTFNYAYNNRVEEVDVLEGNKVTKPNNPTRSGYQFLGWLFGTTNFNFNTLINENITLTANWLKNDSGKETYTVTFDYAYDNIKEHSQVNEGSTVNRPSDPLRSGYRFLGWYFIDNLYNFNDIVEHNLTLRARWELIEENEEFVTVKFNYGYNGIEDEVRVKINEKVRKPVTPVRSGYQFLGWYFIDSLYDFNDSVNYGMTLRAKWQKIEEHHEYVTMTFDYGYNNIKENIQVIKGEKGIKPNNPIRDGYNFLGWYFSGELYNFNNPTRFSLTLLAKWQKSSVEDNYLTITFDHGYDEIREYGQVIVGSVVSEPTAPTRDGYTFLGWYFIDELYEFDEPLDYGITLVARWKQGESYFVTFNYNNFKDNVVVNVNKNSKVKKPLTPYKEDYLFSGWYLNNNKYDFNETVVNSFTLNAKWESISSLNEVSIYNKTELKPKDENGEVGLTYFAIIETKYANNEHGFFVVYGSTTRNELLMANSKNGKINNKTIYKVKVSGTFNNGVYCVTLTGIPESAYNDIITVAPYFVNNNGRLIIAEEFKESTVNYTNNLDGLKVVINYNMVARIDELDKRKIFKK